MSKKLAEDIYQAAYLTGDFTLRSGQRSDHYFDKYQFESDPALLCRICEAMVPNLPESDALAGLELGGIPIATLLAQLTGKPALFVRKKAKAYGTAKLAEGPAFEGKHLLLVEDVVSSGGQLIESAAALRELGARVTHAVCVIDRDSGGRDNLADIGVELVALFTSADLVAVNA